MSLKADIAASIKAHEKLAAYCKGLPPGCEPNKKYYELNSKAHAATNKLPPGIMRSKMFQDLAKLWLGS
jgi:hypothetical protein